MTKQQVHDLYIMVLKDYGIIPDDELLIELVNIYYYSKKLPHD